MYSTPPPGAQFSTERRSFAIVVNLSRWRDLNPRPLPYQGSALPLSYIGNLSGRRGSNSRPSAWKADALSTELLPQILLWAGTDSNCRSREATDLQSARFNHLPTYPKFRASCRIRTNDPEITNHVLWPTELKRRLLVEAAVACFKRVQRYELFLKHQIISSFFAVFFRKKFISHHLSPFFAPKPRFPYARRQKSDIRN